MLKTRLYVAEHEVDQKLASFDITRQELIDVARQTLAARADAIDLDARIMPGMLSYLFGTRHLRIAFLSKGWRIDRTENVESIVNDKLGIKIIFQNVDQACSEHHSPQATSAKGPAATRMIEGSQGELFEPSAAPEAIRPFESPATAPHRRETESTAILWCFCMSFVGDNVSVELSRPSSIIGNNFAPFLERIFIVKGGDWGGVVTDDEDDVVDVLPTIARR